jgi:hypothetical protein
VVAPASAQICGHAVDVGVGEDVVDPAKGGPRIDLLEMLAELFDGLRFLLSIEIANKDDGVTDRSVFPDHLEQVRGCRVATAEPA